MAKRGGNRLGAGRPPGSTTKPRLSDFLKEEEIILIVQKAKELAMAGNESMIKLIIEQNFGKAVQPMEGDLVGNLTIQFDKTFNDLPNSPR